MLDDDGGSERAGLAANAKAVLRSFHFGSATEAFQKSNGRANPRREQPRAIARGKALGESCAPLLSSSRSCAGETACLSAVRIALSTASDGCASNSGCGWGVSS